MIPVRKLVTRSIVIGLALGCAVVVEAPAASAAYATLAPTTWAYTDSHQPKASFVNPSVDVPVGTRRDADGNAHTSRFYFTYDLTSLKGQVVHQATVYAPERSVTDCAVEAPVELWRTGPIKEQTSWKRAPAELERIGEQTLGGVGECPSGFGYDVVPAVNAALARRDAKITFELRIPQARETDPALGRTFRNRPSLTISSNHPPTIADARLESPDAGCGTRNRPSKVNHYSTLAAKVSDRDQFAFLSGQFATWPVTDPQQRQEIGGSSYGDGTVRGNPDLSAHPHGTVLAWAARGYDNQDYSAWTKPCYLEIDREAPTKAPVVISTTYPETVDPSSPVDGGGPGVPGKFRFDAEGDRDVVAYRWSDGSGIVERVAARRPGGPATITYTPRRDGPIWFRVTALDAAGNAGPEREYEFYVRRTAPGVTVDVAGLHLPSTVKMQSSAPEATGFSYQFDGGPEVRFPAVNGAGQAEVTFTESGYPQLTARTYARNKVIGVTTTTIRVDDAPNVESADFSFDREGVVGRAGTFTFRPRNTEITAYTYSFDHGEQQRIDAAGDGSAVLTWTPVEAGYQTLWVRAVRADGAVSESTGYSFGVIDPRPGVYSHDLVSWPRRDGVGQPIELQFDTRMPDVAGFVYKVDDGPELSTPAEFGSARVTYTPQRAGDHTVVVQSRHLDGTLSPAREWPFQISSGPIVTWIEEPDGDGGQTGQLATFRFQPGLPETVEYRYTFSYGEEQTVAAGADGIATVTYTPTNPGYQPLDVTSVSADGTVSETRMFSFIVRDPLVWVSGQYADWRTWGGIGVPGSMSFSTQLFPEVVEYRYQINDGAEQTLAAAIDGVTTHFSITPDRNGENLLRVRSVTAAGQFSPVTEYRFLVGTAPLVTSTDYPSNVWAGGVGVPGTFVFSDGTPGIVEFTYRVDGEEPITVPADAEGRASVVYTPTTSSVHYLYVSGKKADGSTTDESQFMFLVNL
ncbi:hypothetical protein ACIBF5_10585 [Micromonospora sp. NPDC050417]|uniref:hypothetical protein n=1 Tax=Micromonospora sp. NPDC050417 TaxID=3364280 RepID=UPI0037A04215